MDPTRHKLQYGFQAGKRGGKTIEEKLNEYIRGISRVDREKIIRELENDPDPEPEKKAGGWYDGMKWEFSQFNAPTFSTTTSSTGGYKYYVPAPLSIPVHFQPEPPPVVTDVDFGE
jgi:hypothetical protein